MIYTKEQFLAQKNEKENKNIKHSDFADSDAMKCLSGKNYSKIWKYT